MSERRGKMPLDDIGIITVLAIVCYTIIPPLQFLLSGMEYTSESAVQLYSLAPTPKALGAFTWWYVVYLLSFVLGYLLFDSKRSVEERKPTPPDQATTWVLVLLLLSLAAVMFYVAIAYQISLGSVYDERLIESYETFLGMPLLFRQLFGVVGYFLFILKLGLLLTIFLNWNKAVYRYSFYAWMALLAVSNMLWMGARTEMILLALAAAILYHRFVRPLSFKHVLPLGVILFGVFMIIGMMRGASTLEGNLENLTTTLDSSGNILAKTNDFQSLFGGNYDLLQMKQTGSLRDVPLQFRLYEVVAIIPQQILPFEKIDVQQWVIGRSDNPEYFMFNPISQSIIGFGFVELICRGFLLALIFARVRTWYILRASRFWPTLLYFYLVIISYDTIRSTAIYIVTVSVIFRFVPLYFICRLLTRNMRDRRPAVV